MSFLSHLHAELRRARITKRGATHRAEDVPRGTHKEYERMERIMLPEPATLSTSLTEALAKRSSFLSDSGITPLSLSEISALLGHGLRRREGMFSRNYPSGGALFPIETYLITTGLSDERAGVYHYHPTAHALERLWNLPEDFDMRPVVRKPEFLSPTALIVFTSVWERSSAKYGDLSYQHALLEAGHMSENILLLAAAMNLEVRPYAGFDDQLITELLDLNDEKEQCVHTITLAKNAATANTGSHVQSGS